MAAFPARPLPAKIPPRRAGSRNRINTGGAVRAGKAPGEGRRKETELERGQIRTGNTAGLGTGPEQQNLGAAAGPGQDGVLGSLNSWDAAAERV